LEICANVSCKSCRAGAIPNLYKPSPYASAVFFVAEGDKLCNTCNTQVSNLTKENHIAATAALNAPLRASVAGVEHFFHDLMPLLSPADRADVLSSLLLHATTWEAKTLASTMRSRPWSHAHGYSALMTRDALQAVGLAIHAAQLPGYSTAGEGVSLVVLSSLGKQQGHRSAGRRPRRCSPGLRIFAQLLFSPSMLLNRRLLRSVRLSLHAPSSDLER